MSRRSRNRRDKRVPPPPTEREQDEAMRQAWELLERERKPAQPNK